MKQMDIQEVRAIFESHFKTPPVLVQGGGRINLIGEHTDYNEGYVLPASINRHIYFAIAENGTTDCHFIAANLEESYAFSLSKLEHSEYQWANYLIGIMDQLQKQGVMLEGINMVFGGNLPIGAGMSSSAALECGFAFGLCHIFQLEMSRVELAKLAQRSSHEFLGIPCGIMDQFASLLGQKEQAIKLDCRDLTFEYIPLLLGDYELLLVDTGISHDHASGAYKDRVAECQAGVAIISAHEAGITSLRDVTATHLEQYREELGPLLYKRCSYVVAENARLLAACQHLKGGNIKQLGALMFSTHDGLSKKYEVSCPELDFLVDFAAQHPAVAGARMMGGGFGGCTINLIEKSRKEAFIGAIRKAYDRKMGGSAVFYELTIEDGTKLADSHY
jgi:galactokinase